MQNAQLFSILIPTWNNLEFLKLCVKGIRKNSTYSHQIIVHVNDGGDGTLEWVRAQLLDYTHTERNVGICLAMNIMRSKVKTDYMVYMNDDMYALPGWDKALYDEIRGMPDNRFFLSSTMIQPHTGGRQIILADYGDTVENFKEEELLHDFTGFEMGDWAWATLPPNIVHRDIWDLVGGYSVELSPGMYSDPDFTAKLCLCGVRRLKGVSNSKVYHFETKSTTRIRKNMGQMHFLLKWGMTSASFRKHITYRGQAYSPKQEQLPSEDRQLRWQLVRARLKAIWWLATKDFGPQWKFWKVKAGLVDCARTNPKCPQTPGKVNEGNGLKTSIVVSTYNWPVALELSLRSMFSQTTLPSEIVVADDGSGPATRQLIDRMRAESPVPIVHVWQEDKGFRKTTVLNKAIARASGDYILQVDGDVLLSRHFVSDHLELAEWGCFVCGSRVKLSSKVTGMIIATRGRGLHFWNFPLGFAANSFRSRLLRHILATRYARRIDHLRGCNMAFWRNDIIKVNGYNEDLSQWGHEDGEIALRLHFAGVRKKALKMGGNVYHLFHKEASRTNEQRHLDELQHVTSGHLSWCDNGIDKYIRQA